MVKNTFTKQERLCSLSTIEWLFDGKGRSFSVFPLRYIYKVESANEENSSVPLPQVLLSISKKKFHQAVDRNRVKRLIREAYRQQKHSLVAYTNSKHLSLSLAIVFVGNTLPSQADIEESLSSALTRITKSLDHESAC